MSHSLLFSATHLSALFRRAIAHFAQTIREPFNILQAARYGMEVKPDLAQHVEHVMILGRKHQLPDSVLLSVMASSILLDAYPPRMHGTSF